MSEQSAPPAGGGPSEERRPSAGWRGFDWKWGAIIVGFLAAVLIAGAIDQAGSRAGPPRYSAVGDSTSLWRLDGRTGDIVRCEARRVNIIDEAPNVVCERIESRALR